MPKAKAKRADCSKCGTECFQVGREVTSYCSYYTKATVNPPKKAKYRADAEHEFCNQPRTKRVIKEAINNKIIGEEKW